MKFAIEYWYIMHLDTLLYRILFRKKQIFYKNHSNFVTSIDVHTNKIIVS